MFKDSCVTRLLPDGLVEEATALPVSIFPAYIGSGNTVLSVDASGMQGLGHGVQEAFGSMPGAGDMYVLSHGRIADVIDPLNILPYGWFTWEYATPDLAVNAQTLPGAAGDWRRVLCLDEGSVATSMLLGRQCRLEWKVTAPLDKNLLLFQLTIRGYDHNNAPIEPGRKARMKMGLTMRTRAGKPVYDTA